ncbi:MAG: HAMP domain-containing histidine kinase [Candidatus Coatesbacteria bacterium]|nr:HAMP domain-containing histidine kinase [Candidatus Coatesbacteria bacterium]
MTSLVHRFPGIAYKYFSDEGRIRSKTRKSYEELYGENVELTARQASLIKELEDEKNKRVRAERDAIWKDISFSAAHKIGNPIFAIETDLDPLAKRINEDRKADAITVLKNIRSAVEKAKGFVDQFKSLAKAQEIKLIPMLLKPILQDACKFAEDKKVNCSIVCPDDLSIQGDPEKLAECFDELAANATHWLKKRRKKEISLVAISPAPEPLPDFLDSSQKYVLIHVEDNGPGVQRENKNRIFDAFFTTREHGTGLGLALVRRIIDGHKGGIMEVGVPGKGADFEIFVPLSSDSSPKAMERRPQKRLSEG